MESFELDGIGEIKVRRSANIKYLSIRMSPGRGVWVNVPYGVSGRQMIRFVEEKKEWIARNLPKVKSYEKETGVGLGIGAESGPGCIGWSLWKGIAVYPLIRLKGRKLRYGFLRERLMRR